MYVYINMYKTINMYKKKRNAAISSKLNANYLFF